MLIGKVFVVGGRGRCRPGLALVLRGYPAPAVAELRLGLSDRVGVGGAGDLQGAVALTWMLLDDGGAPRLDVLLWAAVSALSGICVDVGERPSMDDTCSRAETGEDNGDGDEGDTPRAVIAAIVVSFFSFGPSPIPKRSRDGAEEAGESPASRES